MISKSIAAIQFEDFQRLIDNGVIESKTLEYKQTVDVMRDREKKEFLADVSSFANALGGDLIYGISENRETGLPDRITGIEVSNFDEFLLQLHSLIRDGIAPRLANICIEKFENQEGKTILLIRISKSWNGPHWVTFNGSNKFYTRSTNGKYPMNIEELKEAFLLTDTIVDRIRLFVSKRVSLIASDTTPIPLLPYGRIVLHLVPISSFSVQKSQNVINEKQGIRIRSLDGGNDYPRFNLDGLLSSYKRSVDPGHESYVQLFRNGIIETVNSSILKPYNNNLGIPISGDENYEYQIIEILADYMKLYSSLGIDFPVFLFVTLVNVKGYKVEGGQRHYHDRSAIDRDIVPLPEVIIQNANDNLPFLLKSLFDIVWNASGYNRSENYDPTGLWKPKR
ncbi:MAG: ATP-binding protein [Chitinophagaceae bacterium]|nr:ATP-binding protein [Chitinophagaceae bacterium]